MAGKPVSPREMLRRLVAFDTTSRNSNLTLIDYVRGYLAGHGVAAALVPSADGSKANLYASIGPMVEGGIVLSGHTDVVPVDGQAWDTDPWQLTEKDGRLYGRGTADMKTFSAVALALVPEFVAAPLKRPVHLALSYDEEVGLLGAPALVSSLMAAVPRPHAVIVGEPTMMTVVNAHNGGRAFVTSFSGVEAHSSMTHLGVSAIHFAGEFIHFLNRLQDELATRRRPDLGIVPNHGTINVGMIAGGTANNILAGQCTVHWGTRTLPGEDDDEVARRAQAFIADTLRPKMRACHALADIVTRERIRNQPFEPAGNQPAEALALAWSGSNGLFQVPYGTEAGIFKRAGAPVVICGPGDIAQAHQPNEFILVEQVEACERFLRRMLEWAMQ
jgi:acetylornithine deacetylase